MEKLLLEYKRGKFVQTLYGNFSKTFTKSPAAMNQAVAKKYAGYLSRRKFDFFCRIQIQLSTLKIKSGVAKKLSTRGSVLTLMRRHCRMLLSINL